LRHVSPILLLLIAGLWVWDRSAAAEEPAEAATKPRSADYLAAKKKTRSWLDGLEVDPVDLLKHGIKGKKKLTEILDAYLCLYRREASAADRQSILDRVKELARQTARREYHDLASLSEKQMVENSMSYLRAAWLLEQFGLDTRDYRQRLREGKPWLDQQLPRRGPWQRAMFAEYYERFGLEKPPLLLAPPPPGVISRRVAVEDYTDQLVYDLTHEVFVAFDYGLRREQRRLSREDAAYARRVLPPLVERYMMAKNPDLVGELLSSMTYLGCRSDARHSRAVKFLLDTQNSNGTWGDYEAYRKTYGRYLEHHVYLHTTMVVLQALVEVYEGDWPAEATEN